MAEICCVVFLLYQGVYKSTLSKYSLMYAGEQVFAVGL